MIRIVDGNAFCLRITGQIKVGDYTEAVSLANITSPMVYFTRRGREVQDYVLDNGKLLVSNSGNLAIGVYSVEIIGYYQGQSWRHMQKNAFEIVDSSSDATEPDFHGAGDVDGYDTTFNVSMGGEEQAAEIATGIVEQHDEKLDAHPTLRALIPTKVSELPNDSGYQTSQQVNATVQSAINSAIINDAEASLVEDGGEPDLIAGISGQKIILVGKNLKGEPGQDAEPLTFDDLTREQKEELRGPVGPQGATGVYDTNQNFLTTLETTPGTSQAKTMSQKSITDELDAINEKVSLYAQHVDTNFTLGCRNVSTDNGQIGSTNSANRYATEIELDRSIFSVVFYSVKFTSNFGYAFVDGNGDKVSAVKTTVAEWKTITRAEILTAIEAGATTLRLGHYDKATEPIGFTVNKFVSGKKITDLTDDVTGLKDNVNVTTIHCDTDFSEGKRNVISTSGQYDTATGVNKYANEIAIDNTFVSVTYRSVEFSGNYGYAFLDDENGFVSGKKITTAGLVTISTADLTKAIGLGATKLRISINDNPSDPEGYTIVKRYLGARFATLENKVANNKAKIDEIDETVTELAAKPIHYNVIGSPVPYIVQSIPDADVENINVFASLTDLYEAYDALVTAHPAWFSKESDLGMDESETYYIRHYCLRYQNPTVNTQRDLTGTDSWSDTTFKPRRIIINMGVHPNEAPSMLGGYLAIKAILESNEPWAQFIKTNFILDIVPCLNPYGLANGQKENVNNLNLNRTYFEDIQAENQCMIDLVQELKPIGLIGIIDLHNCSDGRGYLVGKHNYKKWKYYAVLTQQIAALTYNAMASVYGDRDLHFFLWDSTDDGQLHQYADAQGLLGCTFEIPTALASQMVKRKKGALLSKIITINLINAFGTYE